MSIANAAVAALLRSPLHRMLSGSLVLVRYEGRRTGRTITMPVQYAAAARRSSCWSGARGPRAGGGTSETDRDLDVLLQGRWCPMTGRAVIGGQDRAAVEPLVDAYLLRFPRASKALGDGSRADQLAQAVVVRCRPR